MGAKLGPRAIDWLGGGFDELSEGVGGLQQQLAFAGCTSMGLQEQFITSLQGQGFKSEVTSNVIKGIETTADYNVLLCLGFASFEGVGSIDSKMSLIPLGKAGTGRDVESRCHISFSYTWKNMAQMPFPKVDLPALLSACASQLHLP
jgi:hypothetical protein